METDFCTQTTTLTNDYLPSRPMHQPAMTSGAEPHEKKHTGAAPNTRPPKPWTWSVHRTIGGSNSGALKPVRENERTLSSSFACSTSNAPRTLTAASWSSSHATAHVAEGDRLRSATVGQIEEPHSTTSTSQTQSLPAPRTNATTASSRSSVAEVSGGEPLAMPYNQQNAASNINLDGGNSSSIVRQPQHYNNSGYPHPSSYGNSHGYATMHGNNNNYYNPLSPQIGTYGGYEGYGGFVTGNEYGTINYQQQQPYNMSSPPYNNPQPPVGGGGGAFFLRDMLRVVAETAAVVEGMRLMLDVLSQWFREVSYGSDGNGGVVGMLGWLSGKPPSHFRQAWREVKRRDATADNITSSRLSMRSARRRALNLLYIGVGLYLLFRLYRQWQDLYRMHQIAVRAPNNVKTIEDQKPSTSKSFSSSSSPIARRENTYDNNSSSTPTVDSAFWSLWQLYTKARGGANQASSSSSRCVTTTAENSNHDDDQKKRKTKDATRNTNTASP